MIIAIGIDIVDIQRLRKAMNRQKDRFIHRIYTEAEQRFCRSHRDPVPHYAVRFAAKEAAFKALGTGWSKGVAWLDVEVRRKKQGPPTLVLRGEADRVRKSLGARHILLSMSHSDNSAAAVVILEE